MATQPGNADEHRQNVRSLRCGRRSPVRSGKPQTSPDPAQADQGKSRVFQKPQQELCSDPLQSARFPGATVQT